MPPARKRLSLADVAEIAGVSISTVSKVANGASDVSDSTRERVERILDERGYISTRKRKAMSTVLTLMARDMHSPFTLEVIRGAIEAGAAAGARVVVVNYPHNPRGARWMDELTAAGTDGIIAVTSTLDQTQREALTERGIPLVTIDPENEPDESTFSIGSTNWAGSFNATEYLLQLGHTRIAMLAGLRNTMASRARISGYEAALQAASINRVPEYLLDQDFTYDAGVELGAQLLALREPPTAILAASDFQALGVLEAARQAAVRVPDELSVVGFDDLIVAQMSAPPLTTVHQPVHLMGVTAVQTLLAMSTGEAATLPRRTELATRLVVRGSTAAAPAVHSI